jgi:hypothetical protein
VTTKQIEDYLSSTVGIDPFFFHQYLRDTRVPTLEYYLKTVVLVSLDQLCQRLRYAS